MQINSKFLEAARIERARLEQDSFPDFMDNGFGNNYIVKCNGNALEVKELMRKVLLTINYGYSKSKWPNLDEWLTRLPSQFTCNFAPELDAEEAQKHIRWLSALSYRQKVAQARKKEKWRLGNWLVWMEPSERLWFWWGATEFGEKSKQDYFFSCHQSFR